MTANTSEIHPNHPSSDYLAMKPYYDKVDAILDGLEAMRAGGKKYLPQFPNETDTNYEHRRANSKLTNIFRDIVENLAAKPFAKEVTLKNASARVLQLAEDIDARGNHLHVFAANAFFNGVARSIDWIFVDYTRVPTNLSKSDEAKAGARPYWVAVPATMMIDVQSDLIDGKEQITHARMLEPTVVRVGYGSKTVERVRELDRPVTIGVDEFGNEKRVYGPAVFKVWEKSVTTSKRGRSKESWTIIEQGPISIGVIPLVPYYTGRRKAEAWQFLPAMNDAADLQIELYQQETNLKSIKEVSCFPMLKGIGVNPKLDENGMPEQIPVGCSAVLYAPMSADGKMGDWGYVEPNAQTLTFLAGDVKETAQNLRELGKQPLTAQTGNLTVITTATVSAKGNSACQAWALNLKDALERAFTFTAMWLNEDDTTEVGIFTDFGVGLQDGTSMDRVIKLREKGDIDHETVIEEAKRRGDLSENVDVATIKKRLLTEVPTDESEDDIEAARTPPANDRGKPKEPTEKIAA